MTNHEDEATVGRELTAAALRIEMAWLSEPAPTPSPTREPLESEIDFGFTLTESMYAVGVLDLLEQEGIADAFENVVANRLTLSAYRDVAAEPWEVVAHLLSR